MFKYTFKKQWLIKYDEKSSNGYTFKKGSISATPIVPISNLINVTDYGFVRIQFEEDGITCEELESRYELDFVPTVSATVHVTKPKNWKETKLITLGHIVNVQLTRDEPLWRD